MKSVRRGGVTDVVATHGWRPGFATRLLLAQALMLAAGAAKTWLVASAVGPDIVNNHVRRSGVAHTAAETRHVEDAFSAALLISLALAVLAASACALAAT